MSDFIFKREVIRKGSFYARIKEILIEAGWQNISSRPATDFDVFYSEGEDGNRGLYFNMKEYGNNATSAFSNSTTGTIYFRLIKGYTPSQTVGSAGTFDRTDSWKGANVFNTTYQVEQQMIFHYHCNKNRLIVFSEVPASHPSTNYSSYFSIGVPDRTFGTKSPKHDLILSTSYYDSSLSGVYVTDQVDAPRNASYSMTTLDTISQLPSSDGRSISINGTLFFSEIAYGNNSEGIRGILDGVYALKETNNASVNNYFWLATFKQGDEFIDEDGKRYRILTGYNGSYNSLPTRYFAFRVG